MYEVKSQQIDYTVEGEEGEWGVDFRSYEYLRVQDGGGHFEGSAWVESSALGESGSYTSFTGLQNPEDGTTLIRVNNDLAGSAELSCTPKDGYCLVQTYLDTV